MQFWLAEVELPLAAVSVWRAARLSLETGLGLTQPVKRPVPFRRTGRLIPLSAGRCAALSTRL